MERPTTPDTDPPEERAPGAENLDLVSIGLAVFFVSLILIVGALLILPTLL
jgi:hypothetical protein